MTAPPGPRGLLSAPAAAALTTDVISRAAITAATMMTMVTGKAATGTTGIIAAATTSRLSTTTAIAAAARTLARATAKKMTAGRLLAAGADASADRTAGAAAAVVMGGRGGSTAEEGRSPGRRGGMRLAAWRDGLNRTRRGGGGAVVTRSMPPLPPGPGTGVAVLMAAGMVRMAARVTQGTAVAPAGTRQEAARGLENISPRGLLSAHCGPLVFAVYIKMQCMPSRLLRSRLAHAPRCARAAALFPRLYGSTIEPVGVLESGIDSRSDDYKVSEYISIVRAEPAAATLPTLQRNAAEMARLVAELRERTNLVQLGGGAKALERHMSRGKLAPRQRINGLLDPGSPFLELSPLAGWDLYEGDSVPSGGVITGIGRVHGYVIRA